MHLDRVHPGFLVLKFPNFEKRPFFPVKLCSVILLFKVLHCQITLHPLTAMVSLYVEKWQVDTCSRWLWPSPGVISTHINCIFSSYIPSFGLPSFSQSSFSLLQFICWPVFTEFPDFSRPWPKKWHLSSPPPPLPTLKKPKLTPLNTQESSIYGYVHQDAREKGYLELWAAPSKSKG